MTLLPAQVTPDTSDFRRVMSHFATGIVIVTGVSESGHPLGMTCQSFVSLSLEPPLVSIAPALSSTSWPAIESTGWFAVSILAEHQRHVSAACSRSSGDKLAGVALRTGPLGLPLVEGALAHVECRIDALHSAGDHRIVIGRVFSLPDADGPDSAPLIFHRSSYARLHPTQRP